MEVRPWSNVWLFTTDFLIICVEQFLNPPLAKRKLPLSLHTTKFGSTQFKTWSRHFIGFRFVAGLLKVSVFRLQLYPWFCLCEFCHFVWNRECDRGGQLFWITGPRSGDVKSNPVLCFMFLFGRKNYKKTLIVWHARLSESKSRLRCTTMLLHL